MLLWFLCVVSITDLLIVQCRNVRNVICLNYLLFLWNDKSEIDVSNSLLIKLSSKLRSSTIIFEPADDLKHKC